LRDLNKMLKYLDKGKIEKVISKMNMKIF